MCYSTREHIAHYMKAIALNRLNTGEKTNIERQASNNIQAHTNMHTHLWTQTHTHAHTHTHTHYRYTNTWQNITSVFGCKVGMNCTVSVNILLMTLITSGVNTLWSTNARRSAWSSGRTTSSRRISTPAIVRSTSWWKKRINAQVLPGGKKE